MEIITKIPEGMTIEEYRNILRLQAKGLKIRLCSATSVASGAKPYRNRSPGKIVKQLTAEDLPQNISFNLEIKD